MMEEPPPPSYDEAVTMDLASPPLPLKSPPLPPQTHLPPSPSCPPLPSSVSFSEIPHLNVETRPPVTGQRHARTANNISNLHVGEPDADQNPPSSYSRSKKILMVSATVIIFFAIVAGIIVAILPEDPNPLYWDDPEVPLPYEVYEPFVDCKTKPPNLMNPEATWSNCSTNAKGEYEHGAKCEFKCKDGRFMYVPNSIQYFKENHITRALQPTSANYTCLETKWTSLMEEPYQKFLCRWSKLESSDICHLKDLKKVPGSEDSPDCFYNFGGQKYYISNRRDFYFPGITCTLACPRGYTHYVQHSANKMRKISQSVAFTCKKSKWVSSINGNYKNSQCLKITRKPDCPYIHTPGLAMKNCLQNPKGAYFSGSKCNLGCEENYSYLYMHSNNDIHEVQKDVFVEPINPSDVSCETLEEFRPASKWILTLANGTKVQDKIFQCLKSSNSSVHHDCDDKPSVKKDVYQEDRNPYSGRSYGSWRGSLYCPKKNLLVYKEGTVCTWQCDEGYQLSNDRRKKAAKWKQKMTRFFYTCWNARWKHSLQDSDPYSPSKFRSERLYCVK